MIFRSCLLCRGEGGVSQEIFAATDINHLILILEKRVVLSILQLTMLSGKIIFVFDTFSLVGHHFAPTANVGVKANY